MTPAQARSQPHDSHPLSAFELAVPGLFVLVLVTLVATSKLPPGVLLYYLFTSALGFAMYWQDKAAAARGRWRTSESALLVVALIGGWPGGFLARHIFRHKTRKQPFRTYFWLAVALNCMMLAMITVGMNAAPG